MYRLPQAGVLANKLLAKRLNLVRYYHCQYTLGLWRNVWHPITSSLVVNDFGIKTVGLTDAKHLIQALKKYYEVDVDWKGQLYSAPIQYGQKVQLARELDTSPKLSPNKIEHIQQVVGTLLYYSCAVDPTLAATLSTIASQQSNRMQAVLDACKQLLDFAATHANASIQYCACNMILALDTDSSYLSEPEGKSCAAEYFYLTNQNDPDFHNGAVLVLSAIIKHSMTSARKPSLSAQLSRKCASHNLVPHPSLLTTPPPLVSH
eukprot:CCRYP_008137-RA/>CCRYP_008137-RA protein AED:0.38 eAED:0.40 QI:0/0/0/1/1/1/2/0/261